MGGFAKIDKSIAWGFFNQEIRTSEDIRRGSGYDFDPDPRNIETVLFNQLFTRNGGKLSLPAHALRSAARKMSSHRLRLCERIFSLNHRSVQGSDRKSFLEISYRKRPSIIDDILIANVNYAYAKQDRVVMAKKISSLVVTGHAMRRFFQRADGVSLEEKVLAPALDEMMSRSGLFAFLANVAGRGCGTRFASPFREGLVLCEISAVSVGATLDYFMIARQDRDSEKVNGSPARFVHPMGWDGSGQRKRCVVSAMTYIGRNEMKEGQVAFHELAEGFYQRNRKEIDLLGDLDGVFYPGHNAALYGDLDAAAPKLDAATRDMAAALSWDRKLSYAFSKEDLFDAAGVDLPSAAIRLGREGARRHAETAKEFGVLDRGGGLFCHSPVRGFYEAARGRSTLEAEEAFSNDPYSDPLEPESIANLLKF